MKVTWAISPDKESRGNNLGYGSTSRLLRTALSSHCDIVDDGDIYFHYCHPFFFKPRAGRMNVLYTMFESSDLTYEFYEAFDSADLIATPSSWCAEIFQPATKKEVHVCPLGVDPSVFTFKKRELPKMDQKFRYLYLGAPNARKFSIMDEVYRHTISQMPDCEFYAKTTGADFMRGVVELYDRGLFVETDGDIVKHENFTADNRLLGMDGLVGMYHDAHCFVIPTLGEGWNQVLLEAMATGLTCIVTAATGHMDFANSTNSYLVKYREERLKAEISRTEDNTQFTELTAYVPDIWDFCDKVIQVRNKYSLALKVGRQASYTARKLTWERAGRILFETLNLL